MTLALVAATNLGADFDVGSQVAGKINVVAATTGVFGKMRFATATEATSRTAGVVLDAAQIGAAFMDVSTTQTVGGSKKFTAAIQSSLVGGLQWAAPGYLFYSDSSNFYVLLASSGNGNSLVTTFSSLRPLSINISTGKVSMGAGVAVSGGLTADTGSFTALSAPTQAPSDSSTSVATTACVDAKIAAVTGIDAGYA